MRAGSTGSSGNGAAAVNTEISRARRGSSSGSTGGKRGSARAAAPGLPRTTARQLVWKREARQAPDPLGPAQHRRRQGFGAAQGERHVAPLQLPAGGPVRQLGGRPLVSLLRQRDEARALGNCVENSRLGLHFPLLHLRVTPQPLEVSVTRRPQRRVPHAAHRDDVIAHQAYIPRSRCIAATRSIAIMYDAIRVFTLWRSAQVTTSENERTMMLSSRRLTVSSSQK